MTRKGWIALAVVIAALSGTAKAAVPYRIDDHFATVGFAVRCLSDLFTIDGVLHGVRGNLLVDMAHPSNSRVDVTAETASADTGWTSINRILRRVDYLAAARYPTIRFVSTRVETITPTHVRIHGSLTLRGVTAPETFDARLLDRKVSPNGTTAGDFVVTGSVDLYAFGLTAHKVLVGRYIDLNVQAHIKLPAKVGQ